MEAETPSSKAQAEEIVYEIEQTPAPKPKKGSRASDFLTFLFDRISEADEEGAMARVQQLRADQPDASTDDLVEILVKRKCQETATVGAATAGAALIPGLGTLTALTIGVAADIGATFKLQAELVLEIAEAHGYPLNQLEKQQVVMLVTGVSAGGNQLLTKAGRELSVKVTERYARKWLATALPVIGVAASAGTNVLSTYIIGQRADAYFGRGPEALVDWKESLRAVTGVDERKVGGWLADAGERSWLTVSSGARRATSTVKDAGQAAGGILAGAAEKAVDVLKDAGENVVGARQMLGGAATATGGLLVDKLEDAKDGILSATGKAVGSMKEAGSSILRGGRAAGESAQLTTPKIAGLLPPGQSEESDEEGMEEKERPTTD
ncbi:MAG: hypothetical protein H0T73_15245 [Ardenticatenales bacterium]|nr:hypothetical protein [Ardenticatenales bacterium]